MEFLKKYSGLFTFVGAVLGAVAICLTCFISQEWYFIVGIIIFSLLTICFTYLYGWNKGQESINKCLVLNTVDTKFRIKYVKRGKKK